MATVQTATPKKTTTWQVDPAHTHVEFAVKHLMIATEAEGQISQGSRYERKPL
jgi:polyisoprenoid-binding protein YceI